MPNVSNNVFQAITNATKSNRDISTTELANIKKEMEQNGIDAGEQEILTKIEQGSSFTVSNGTQSATISPSEVSFPNRPNAASTASSIVSANTDHGYVYNDLKEEDLGKALANSLKAQLGDAPMALAALKQVNDNEVVEHMIKNLSDADLKRLSENDKGRELLRFAYSELNSNRTNSDEGKQMQRIVQAASRSHGHLAGVEFNVPPAVQAALDANGATLQRMSEGSTLRAPNYDTYETTVRFEDPAQAQALFEQFAKNPNAVGDGYFDAMNVFTLRGGGGTTLPKTGDIYDIDIAGPDNGSVMVVGGKPIGPNGGSIVVATITEKKYGEHPENGTREFGFRRNDDGSFTFYTKGASRGINSATQTAGAIPQEQSWRGLIDGFQQQAVSRGATVERARNQSNTDTPF